MIKMFFSEKYSILIKSFFVILFPLIFFRKIIALVLNEALHNEMATHILAIPFLIVYILYRIRNRIIVSASQEKSDYGITFPIDDLLGILLTLLSFFLSWYGSHTFYSFEINLASIPIFVAGMVALIFNLSVLKTLAFPVSFLFFLVIPPFEYAQQAGFILSDFSSRAAFNLLKVFSLPVSLSFDYGSPIIYLATIEGIIPFTIDLACSGLYSLIGYTLFAVFVAYLAKTSLVKKFSILLLGLPIIYFLNIIRITTIVIVGHFFGSSLALNVIHFFGGWTIIFLGTLLILVASNRLLKIEFFSVYQETCSHATDSTQHCVDCGKIITYPQVGIKTNDIAKIIAIFSVILVLLFVQVPLFTLASGSPELLIQKTAGEQNTELVLPTIDEYDLRFGYRDTEFENISGQDASLWYLYNPHEAGRNYVWVGLEIGQSKGCLHPWEVCLITWPETHGGTPQVEEIDLRDIYLIDNPPLPARYFAYTERDTDETQVILYWYVRSVFETSTGFQEKWVKISVVEIIYDPENYEAAELEILPIAQAITEYWTPVTSWSWISLFIAKNGPFLVSLTIISILAVIGVYFNVVRVKKKEALVTFLQLSSGKEQGVLKAIGLLENEIASESMILSKYREISGEVMDVDSLKKALSDAEESGLIYRAVVNVDDVPYCSWKNVFYYDFNDKTLIDGGII